MTSDTVKELLTRAVAGKDALATRYSADLGTFCRRAWREIDPQALSWNWHHDLICEYLMLAYRRQIPRLVITMPPRGGKSRLVSILFPAWCWTHDPSLSFILASYSDSLSTELSVIRRKLLTSSWYAETWPNKVRFSADQNRKDQYQNAAHGQMIATSITGTVAGKGCDFLLVDDPISPQQSFSDVEREGVNRDFDSTFRSRLNQPDRGVIIVIMQRTHERDLVGHVLEREPGVWTHLSLPMVAPRDEEIRFPLSGRVVHRRTGDLLHPKRFSAEWVEQQKTASPHTWAGQYLQSPAPPGGAIFKSEWFRYYDQPPQSTRIIISLDTAYAAKKTADYSVATVWAITEHGYSLVWVWRERAEFPTLKSTVVQLAEQWKPEAVLVEYRASGQSLVQELKSGTRLPIVPVDVSTDKISRAHSVCPMFSSGRVSFPKQAPWLADVLHELELFPAAVHDDIVDSVSMALGYLRDQMRVYGVLELARAFREKRLVIDDSGAMFPFTPPPSKAPPPDAPRCPKCHSAELIRSPAYRQFAEHLQCNVCRLSWPTEASAQGHATTAPV